MRRMLLIVILLCWTTSQALAAGCSMTGAPAPAAREHAPHHHPTPKHPPAHHAATECGMVMPCGVPAAASGATGVPRAPDGGRGTPAALARPHASPDLNADPPPPKRSRIPG